MGIIQEFKEFALKGSVIDLAVGLVIGSAFGKIVSSLVQDIIMPILSKIMTDINLAKYDIILTPAKIEEGKEVVPAVAIHIGLFISAIIDFTFIAVAIFFVVKALAHARTKIDRQ